jgi:hypothetical protein
MASSFLVRLSRIPFPTEATLREEIAVHTESDEETDSILRGMERLGRDSTITHYEMTRMENRPSYRGQKRVSWSVRAIRP